jgi:hypothetical protein
MRTIAFAGMGALVVLLLHEPLRQERAAALELPVADRARAFGC